MSEQPFIPAVGGDVQASGGTYIRRLADDQLLQACLANEFAYVLASRQIGKSSLKNAVAEHLIAHNVHVSRIDLNRIGQAGMSAEKWYFGLLDEIARTLGFDFDVEEWWSTQPQFSPLAQRFVRFFDEIVLTELQQPIVIFIDEIDVTLDLPFTNDLFAIIRSLYNDRAQNSNYRRLTFVLLGVASPDELINDPKRTPFNIGKAIEMRDFQWAECEPLRLFMTAKHPEQGEHYFKQIYAWTNGHPYLTQKLCLAVAKTEPASAPNLVDALVSEIFFKEGERIEANLHFVQNRVLQDKHLVQMIQTYEKILQHHSVRDDKKSPAINRLSLYGLVVADNGILRVRNKLYEEAFDSAWCRENNPRNWSRIIAAVAVGITVLVISAFIGVYSYNRHIDNVDRDTNLHFYRTHYPKERAEALATLLELKYFYSETRNFVNEARDLFFGLSAKEQFELFHIPDDKIVIVIQGLYTTLADVNTRGHSTPLLQAMADALDKVAKTEEISKLSSEINYWVEGRNFAKQGQEQRALNSYNKAIALNGENLSTRYERARTHIELVQYGEALADLDQIIAIIIQSGESMVSEQTISATFTMTPTSFTPTQAPTPTDAQTSIPENFDIGIPPFLFTITSTSTVIAILLPKSIATPTPTATPVPDAMISEFSTGTQMIAAVRNLINNNPKVMDFAIQSNQQTYPNLLTIGLVLTPSAIALGFTPTLSATSLAPLPTPTSTPTMTSAIIPDFTPTSSVTSSLTSLPTPASMPTTSPVITPDFTPTSSTMLSLTPPPIPISTPTITSETIARAARSVVRIRAQKCDISDCIDNGIGSGAIIHPGGIILTAWHVTVINGRDKSSDHLDRFVIEMADNLDGIPSPKYRAELIASSPEQDVAFLQITTDATGEPITLADLPFLPIYDNRLEPSAKLLIRGYSDPLTLSPKLPKFYPINKITHNDIALEVPESLQKGYSGGPALIDHAGQLEIVGIVHSLDPNSSQIVHVQGLSGLTQMRWISDADPAGQEGQIWGKKMEFLSLDVKGVPTLRITTNLYTFNHKGQTGRLVAYAFDTKTYQPLKASQPTLPQSLDGQLALHQNFDIKYYVDRLTLSIEVPIIDLDLQIPIEQIAFRLVVLGNDSLKLWEGEQWYDVTIINPIPTTIPTIILPSATQPADPTPTALPPFLPSGRIAFPLLNNGKIDIGIYCFSTNKICHNLPAMRQPDFSAGGYLVVNGEGDGRESLFRMDHNYDRQEPISLHPEDAHPQWSPDGLSIIFASTSFGEDNLSRIYWQEEAIMQPLEETPPLRYGGFTLNGRAPVYLSNWHIAYNGCDTWGTWSHCGIYTVEHQGQDKPIQITGNPNDIPTDGLGARVLFMSNREDTDWEIYIANWNEFNSMTRLTNSPGCDGLATASPDGQYIAFMTNREGPWAVYIMRPDGSGQVKLFDIPNAGFNCSDEKWLDERMSWGS